MAQIKGSILLLFYFFLIFPLKAQIPYGYYDSVIGIKNEKLKSALHEIIKDHFEFAYTSRNTDTWDILKETDIDPLNPDNIILLYSGWSIDADQEYNNGKGWCREHVWAKSHGEFGTDIGAGTDLHHLKPTDISVNGARRNVDFDDGGRIYVDVDGPTECKFDNDSWEPRDNVKGDVARILFYMAVRYEGDNGEQDLELLDETNTASFSIQGKGFHGKLSTLLEWHKIDPVDDFEKNRNNIIYSYQKNRNPFIDHPEFAAKIWKIEDLRISNEVTGKKTAGNITKNLLVLVLVLVFIIFGIIFTTHVLKK